MAKHLNMQVAETRYNELRFRRNVSGLTWANLAFMFQALANKYHADAIPGYAQICELRASECEMRSREALLSAQAVVNQISR